MHDKKLQYKDLVTQGTKDAFDLAKSAADALSDIRKFYSQSDQSNPTPIQQAQIDLFGYLFSNANASNDDDKALRQITDTFEAIRSFLQHSSDDPIPKPRGPPFTRGGVLVYCSYARLEEGHSCQGAIKHEDQACDTDLNIDIGMGDWYHSCKNSTDPNIAAWVAHDSKDPDKPAQIQMCSWFLAELNNRPYKYLKDIIGPKAFLSRVYNWGLVIGEDRTMMDAACTIGHSILHELSHSVSKDRTWDIDQKQSYGWKNCNRLSKKERSADNADSYAYFALGAKLINPGGDNKPQRPMKDGSIRMLDLHKEGKREYNQENYRHSTHETGPMNPVKPTSHSSTLTLDISSLAPSANVEANRASADSPMGRNRNQNDTNSQTGSPPHNHISNSSNTKPSSTLRYRGYSQLPPLPPHTHLKRQPLPVPTASPIYEYPLGDGRKEWYYFRELVLDELSTATWPTVTWTATKYITKTQTQTSSASAHHAAPTNVDLGILTCGSPDPETINNSTINAPLFKRTDQGHPEYWMSFGKPGQSGLIDGVSVFCNFLSKVIRKIDMAFPPRSSGIDLSYNKNLYDPIYFGLEWSDNALDNCPVLDFVGRKNEAMEVCKERLGTIINKCDTSSNNYHWWKQGGTFFRDCLTWKVYRDKWSGDGDSIPTNDTYRPRKKCKTNKDCDCGFGKGWGGAEVCADMAEWSDLGWCTCWDRNEWFFGTHGDDDR
ncbi:hypothetical protein FQN54_007035 [Arachnomyces sp. PD_36]|nr:hypothetical protein FQN54_007035 [Arachnomyces sp. PD_36]